MSRKRAKPADQSTFDAGDDGNAGSTDWPPCGTMTLTARVGWWLTSFSGAGSGAGGGVSAGIAIGACSRSTILVDLRMRLLAVPARSRALLNGRHP
jgi:hypothetical protein